MKKRIEFQLEGQTYSVEVEREGERLLLKREGKSYTVTLTSEASAPAAKPPTANRPEPRPAAPVSRPAAPAPRPAPTPKGGAGAVQPGDIVAPMTGVVKEVKVSAGQRVEKGNVVLVMEAMKMDIDIPAPSSGTVAEILVRPAETVNTNQRLVRLA